MKMLRFIPLLVVLCGLSRIAWADGTAEPIPSFYEEPGISRTRDYTDQHANEHIDPFTGKLQWHFVDLFIPGNGGLDLKVQRSYNSLNELFDYAYSPVGLGWTMHFGRVLRNATTAICGNVSGPLYNPVLEMPDGGRRILYLALDGVSWITTDFWKAECNNSVGGLNVYAPDGTRYEMTYPGNPVGSATQPIATYYVTKATDRNGNWISFAYDIKNDGPYANLKVISSATSSDGRAIVFNYKNEVLDTITDGTVDAGGGIALGSRVWTYVQSAAPVLYATNYLKQVIRPDGNSWQFEYNETQGATPFPGLHSMRRITYPAGGTIDYTYDFTSFAGNTSIPRSTVVKQKAASPGGTWSWTYTPATQPVALDAGGTGFSYSMPPTAAQEVTFDKTTVSGPDESRIYYHFGYNSALPGYTYLIGYQLGNTSSVQNEMNSAQPVLISNQTNVRPGNSLVFDGATAAPLTVARYVGRFGELFTTRYSNFDNYGNAQTITETGTNTKVTNLTYNIDPAKWIIHQVKDETVTEGSESLSVTRTFDPNGNLLSETHAGVPTTYTYTAEGDVASRTDARQKTTNYSNYYRGIARTENQPMGVTITREVSSAGNITSQTDGELSKTSFSYDGLNRVTGITHPLGNPVTVDWGTNTRTVTRGTYRAVTAYDGFGRAISDQHSDNSTGESIVQNYQVDSLGRRVFQSYPNVSIGSYFNYDMLNRKTVVYNEATPTLNDYASFRQYDYYSYGVRLYNENTHTYFYGSRSYGNPDQTDLISIQTPMDMTGPSTTITRNIARQMTSITQDSVTRSYGYDTRFYLTSITDPETGVTVMGRDEVGNMTSRQVGSSGQTSYVYDDRNRQAAITYPAGTPGVTKSYYKDDKLKSIDNGVARRDYVYDANKNLLSETLTVGSKAFPTSYAYNGNDAQTSITYGSTKAVTYAPDAFGRARQAMPYVTSVSYHPSGQPSSIAYANGVTTAIGLNARQWPASLKIAKGGNFFDMTYLYDKIGNVQSISDNIDSSYNRILGYDAIDRLTTVVGPWGVGNIGYDLRGNIASQSLGTFNLTYTYNSAAQRLDSVSGSKAYTMSYDLYGNVIGNGATTFSYNDAANMQCAKCGQPDQVLYDYDGANQRVHVLKGGVETYFIYGANGQLLWEETPHASLKEYIYLGDKQVATREQVLQ